MDNATHTIIEKHADRIAALEAQLSDLRREFRTRSVVVVDEVDKPRMTLSCNTGGVAELFIDHPTNENAYVALVAGNDVDMPNAAPAAIEVAGV